MKSKINLVDVLDIAIQIEEQGAQFYRKAAEAETDPELSGMFARLAREEEGHANSYRKKKEALIEGEDVSELNVSNEIEEFIHYSVKGNFFDLRGVERFFTGERSIRELIEAAIDMENRSISFYAAIRESATDETTRKMVNNIMSEELFHVVYLGKRLEMGFKPNSSSR